MRLWTLHPRLLDARGLVALWREGLLAQAVLQGKTRGYTEHPQLERFKEARSPRAAIASYLIEVRREALRRGYEFDERKIGRERVRYGERICTTRGQLIHEWEHLAAKLRSRAPAWLRGIQASYPRTHSPRSGSPVGLRRFPIAHPLFKITSGSIEPWERA